MSGFERGEELLHGGYVVSRAEQSSALVPPYPRPRTITPPEAAPQILSVRAIPPPKPAARRLASSGERPNSSP